jgi:Tol biopolymer transport system component
MSAAVRKVRGAMLCAAVLLCVLTTAPTPAHATFPGRPGLIVFNKIEFHDDGEVTGGLFAIRPGKKQTRQLTSNSMDYDPSFNPTGKRLVFRRSAGTGEGIYVLDLQTGKTRLVTSHQGNQSPAFGPRGMIVVSRLIDDSYDLILYTRNGKTRRLTSDDGSDQQAVFAPDGKRILFLRDYRKAVALSQQRTGAEKEGVYSIRVDGTGLKFLRAGNRSGFDFDLSPDGRRTTFRGSFSPDGRKLAYANRQGLWVRRTDGKRSPALLLGTNYQPYQEGGSLIVQPAWQPLPQEAEKR